MKNKLIIMLCIVGVTFSMSTKVMASTNIQRICGDDRYNTAIEICKSGWTNGSEYAVLASGENFPDALSAAPLAKKYNAPILLNPGTTLDTRVEDELKKLGVKQVFIIGGSAVIADTVKDKIEKLNIKTTRLWGQDRYETAVKVAEQLDFKGEIFVANGENFPDAVSAAPIAAKKSMPIILTPNNNLPTSVIKYMKDRNISKTYVIGDDSVVSKDIFCSLPNAERTYGDSRYDTNIAVLNKFKNELDFSKIYFANGENFPDALAGSALASKNSSAIILVNDDSGQPTKDFVLSKIPSQCEANIIGGSKVVSNELINYIIYPSGNTNGNVCLDGLAAKQGEWVYYTNYPFGGLYKSKEDGSSSTKLDYTSCLFRYINILGDWIYYSTGSDIYKIKTDGSSKTRIVGDIYCRNMIVIGDIIYYVGDSNKEGKEYLCKINTDGSENTVLNKEDQIFGLNIVGNWAYYINESDNFKIYKMKLDGSSKMKVIDDTARQILLDNGFIYYSTSNGIYKTKIDNLETVNIVDEYNTSKSFNIANDWIYYQSKDGCLHKVKIDGSGNSTLIDIEKLDFGFGASIITTPNIVGNWIYYHCCTMVDVGDAVRWLYKGKIDGSQNINLHLKYLQDKSMK